MLYHFLHTMETMPDGTLVMLDVVNTEYIGWEGAYAVFDRETFEANWAETAEDEDTSYTAEDVADWAEEMDAFTCWNVVSNRHRTPEAAEKALRKELKKIFKA